MNLNMLYETVRQALKNIASNKFRTLLTMLGIIIGIMAVMIIVGLGNGLTQSMRASVSSMGMNLLQVNVFGPRARNVSVDEMYRITEERPDLFSGISPMVSMDRTSSAVRVGTKNYSQTSVIGISETYAGMTGTKIAEGRGIQYVDCAEYKRVCVVGDYIARVAYGGNAIGQTLKLGPDQFTIIGVAAAEVSDPSLQEGSSDDYVYIPYTTAQRVARSSNVSAYGVTTVTEAQVAEGKAVLEAGLQELTHSEDSYFVTSLSEVLNTAGGRHRHHEHHDGVGGRAHPRDRHPQGPGRQGAHHPGPVRHRGGHHLGPGRPDRHHPGLRRIRRGQPPGGRHDGGHQYDHQPVGRLGGGGLWGVGGHRHPVRLPARQACRPPQPHRGPAL